MGTMGDARNPELVGELRFAKGFEKPPAVGDSKDLMVLVVVMDVNIMDRWANDPRPPPRVIPERPENMERDKSPRLALSLPPPIDEPVC